MMVEDFSMYARSDLNRSLKEEPQVLEKVWTGNILHFYFNETSGTQRAADSYTGVETQQNSSMNYLYF